MAAVRAHSIVVGFGVAAATLLFGARARAQPRAMDAGVSRDGAISAPVDATASDASDDVRDGGSEASATTAPDSRDTEAHALYVAGRAAVEGGRFADARRHFVRAWELTGRPFLLYEIGRACDLLRRDAEALEAFGRYLREVPEAANRDEVRGRVQVLRRLVAAAQARTPAPAAPRPRAHRIGGPTVLETWWFWTIVGAAVVGGVAIAVTVSTNAETRPPIPGDLPPGGVIEALEAP
jgi:tetratricopeptide (TPR) repeat protein